MYNHFCEWSDILTGHCSRVLVMTQLYLTFFYIRHHQKRYQYLACNLAAQPYFEENIPIKCTVGRLREYPALPREELVAIKQKLFLLFPQF